jgi:hypothetical protein
VSATLVTDDCESKCTNAASLGALTGGAACTHWAHDAKDNECYLFAACLDEGDDSDYNLFKLAIAASVAATPAAAAASSPAAGSAFSVYALAVAVLIAALFVM